ncbi:MAG: adenine phosphoribosyltransferase [Elusimicrobiota bacterium]
MVQTNPASGQKNALEVAALLKAIRNVPDFPKPGIQFKDVTPLLGDPKLFKSAIDLLVAPYKGKKVDYIAGIESRGFIFGAACARALDCGFVPIRKKGKLPCATESADFDLEYGKDTIEIHKDAFSVGKEVVIVDDVLATGGTAKAAIDLVSKAAGRVIGISFLIELSGLKGRDKLTGHQTHALITF